MSQCNKYVIIYVPIICLREEDEAAGFVIDTEDIGLRLKAFEYWKCAETGLSSGHHPESIKFVIAEALPNQGT